MTLPDWLKMEDIFAHIFQLKVLNKYGRLVFFVFFFNIESSFRIFSVQDASRTNTRIPGESK